MREIDLHVPFETIDEMGFDFAPQRLQDVEVRHISLISCGNLESIAAITYSEPVDEALANSDSIVWWERIDQDETDPTYLCKAVGPDFPEEPSEELERRLDAQAVTIEDGGYTVTFVGPQEALQCQPEFIRSGEFPISLRRLKRYEGPHDDLQALTRRQREVLETAYELGYYEVPRETTASEIARALGIERATVSEHLQRAERNLLAEVLSD